MRKGMTDRGQSSDLYTLKQIKCLMMHLEKKTTVKPEQRQLPSLSFNFTVAVEKCTFIDGKYFNYKFLSKREIIMFT